MGLPIYVPVAYISFLVVSMLVFSKIYRKKTLATLASNQSSWFPEGHLERDIYQTLVGASEKAKNHVSNVTDASEKAAASATLEALEVPLKAALLNRAMTDVRRILRMRDDKAALTILLAKGSIGDDTMKKFQMAEKELEAEILDVVSEANTFREGWGQLIFPTASEMVNHLKHKEVYYDIAKQREDEVKKLKEAGKPIPQPTIEMPPLMTPPGTQINVQVPSNAEGSGGSSSNTTLSVQAPTESSPGIPQGPQLVPNLPTSSSSSGNPLQPQANGGLNPQQMQQMIFQAAMASQLEGTGPNGQPTQEDIERAKTRAQSMLQAAQSGDTVAQQNVQNAVGNFQNIMKMRAQQMQQQQQQQQQNGQVNGNGSGSTEEKENEA